MIHVIATIKARDGQRNTLVAAFREILPEVRVKAGCLQYALALHLPTSFPGQAQFDDNEFILIETWVDLASLKAHITNPAYQAWYMQQWHLVSGASMQVFRGRRLAAADCIRALHSCPRIPD
jgi:quinol monooxygenase YgiN